ncbi:SusC/RagA family TonB-linked outer membrane protein [Olivibacter sitiensis]|uniref:SusC/RagA family TonB-linked outer membrane protein n=1 Tax=Olivibacter sitiensis TaxID=376470 RepID=UPI000411993A|nr:TonB-dependent receptor [Olivibacter sitiensis]
MIRNLFLSLCFFVYTLHSFAQSRKVSGLIKDAETSDGLPGVSVLIKGSNGGTQSDAKGAYSITIPDGEVTLVFRFMGYKQQEIAVRDRKEIDVLMESDANVLDEVVAIGYATVSRKDLTGSVSSVGERQLRDIPLSSAAEALTGRLAGVNVATTEGSPGADVTIRVRGGGSITQDNTPLYIVDGIQVENALSILSPQEIESIDVLKDAASTSIYGARGANGVVVITTKGGKGMPTQISYNGFVGMRNITNQLDVMDPYDFVMYQYQAYNFNTNEQTRNSFRDTYGRWEDLELYRQMPFRNWQQDVFGRDAWGQTHILSLTGGDEKTTFNASINHTDENGIMLNSGFKRTLAALKLDHNVSKKLKAGASARYSSQLVEGVGTSATGGQSNNRLRNSVRYIPFVAPGMEAMVDEFDPDFANQTNLVNPVLLANNEIREDTRNNLILNGYFNYNIIKNLTFRSTFGYNKNWRDNNVFNGSVTGLARQNANKPVVDLRRSESDAITFSNTLSYRWNIDKRQRVDALLGQEIYEIRDFAHNSLVKWLPEEITAKEAFAGIQRATPGPGQIQDAPTTFQSTQKLFSLFTRLNYSFGDRYLATFSLRRDGSSLFSPENRYSYFPSAALAWRLSEEQFMQSTKNWLSDLKLRFSYGSSGNNRIGLDRFKTMYNISGNYAYAYEDNLTPGLAPDYLANPNLKWETTVSRNLGLDFDLFKGRLSASVDVYTNSVKDLLLDARIPTSSGYITQFQNIGETQNKGLEIQLSSIVVDKADFSYSANFNLSFNRNKIVSLGINPDGSQRQSYLERSGWVSTAFEDFMVEVGQPIGQFYGYVTDGYYQLEDFDYNATTGAYTLRAGVPNSRNVALGNREPQPGDLKLMKLTDDDNMIIGANDRTVLGNAQPKFIGGLNQQFRYKDFDMSVFMNWSVGNKVYNANKIEFTTQYLYRDNNMLSTMNDRWQWYDGSGLLVTDPAALAAMNENTTMWTPPLGQYFLHSWAVEDGSFLRISNVTLGYSLPKQLLNRIKIKQLRVYGTVNNLWTITGYSGYDPEANTRRSNPLTPAVDYAAYPRSRYVVAGVNLTF